MSFRFTASTRTSSRCCDGSCGAARRGGEVVRQVGADADRAGGVRRRAPLGAGAARLGTPGGADPAAIHQAPSLRWGRVYVKRGKNDAIRACPRAGPWPDPWAAAICEAMSRPGMWFVPVKSAESQAAEPVLGPRAARTRGGRPGMTFLGQNNYFTRSKAGIHCAMGTGLRRCGKALGCDPSELLH